MTDHSPVGNCHSVISHCSDSVIYQEASRREGSRRSSQAYLYGALLASLTPLADDRNHLHLECLHLLEVRATATYFMTDPALV